MADLYIKIFKRAITEKNNSSSDTFIDNSTKVTQLYLTMLPIKTVIFSQTRFLWRLMGV